MSMFTLAISCLTTSNLPRFMDLTFQDPMQYCSLQHRTLLLSPVTSTTGYSFCFGSIPSFFMELFLYWSPVVYWAPTDLGSSSFGILSFCLFILDRKKIQPVHSKGNQSWVFFGRNDAKAETPVLWPPHAKSWLTGKDSDAGRDWGQEEKGTTEDEMAGWHHWLDGLESEWTLGVGDGQGGLACCDSWGRKESDTTERLIWSDLIWSDRPPRSQQSLFSRPNGTAVLWICCYFIFAYF